MSIRRKDNIPQYDDLFEHPDRWGTFVLANVFWVLPSISFSSGAVRQFHLKRTLAGLLALNFSNVPLLDKSNLIACLSRSLFLMSPKWVFIRPLWLLGLFVAATTAVFIGVMLPPLALLSGVVSCSVCIASWETWLLSQKPLPLAQPAALDN